MTKKFNHTNESDAVIREGVEAGVPYSAIAVKMGLSKNMVVGRAFRIGLSSPAPIKLTPDRVREARSLYFTGLETNITTFAKRFGVAPSVMWRAIHHKSWKHI